MAKKKDQPNTKPSQVNRQARFEYEILERYVAGIMLTGSEVKSIRDGKAQLAEAYCGFQGTELWIRGMLISPYTHGGYANHESTRTRKLLLHQAELTGLRKSVQEKGLTVVPLKLFFNERNLIKMEIGLARGKKLFDKRASIKERDLERSDKRESS
jgi:SsrA-binding protein